MVSVRNAPHMTRMRVYLTLRRHAGAGCVRKFQACGAAYFSAFAGVVGGGPVQAGPGSDASKSSSTFAPFGS